jgi:hypothetical protein
MQPGRSTGRIILDTLTARGPDRTQGGGLRGLRHTPGPERRGDMRAENADVVNCPSCGATLIAGLRFCRMCGYRLGEGLDEYVPTQRLDGNGPQPFAPPRPSTDPFAPRQTWGAAPMQPIRPFGAASPGRQEGATGSLWSKACSAKRGGLTWLWITIALMIVLSVGGAALKSAIRAARGGAGGDVAVANSLLKEADDFVTADSPCATARI